MSHIPSEIYESKLPARIHEILNYSDATDFHSLNDWEQDELVALAMKVIDLNSEIYIDENIAECIRGLLHPEKLFGKNDSDEFKQMVIEDDKNTLCDLLKAATKKVYSNLLDALVEEIVEQRATQDLWDEGYRPEQDDTGYTTWNYQR